MASDPVPAANGPARGEDAGRRGGILGRLRGLLAERSGIGAVEFALIAPLLLLLYVSGTEVAIAVTLNRKVNHTAATVNDLVTQAASVSAAELDGIFQISSAIIEPYPQTPLKIRVSSVTVDAAGTAKVDCSRGYAGRIAALGRGTPYTMPAELKSLRSRTILVAETFYDYAPLAGFGLKDILKSTANPTGVLKMGETSYLNPRIGTSVACSDW